MRQRFFDEYYCSLARPLTDISSGPRALLDRQHPA